MPDHTCPKCRGRGEGAAFVDYRGGASGFALARCLQCHGFGRISDTALDWIRRGEAMRHTRQQRRQTLRDRATELGVSLTDLSAAEQGRIDPTPFADEATGGDG